MKTKLIRMIILIMSGLALIGTAGYCVRGLIHLYIKYQHTADLGVGLLALIIIYSAFLLFELLFMKSFYSLFSDRYKFAGKLCLGVASTIMFLAILIQILAFAGILKYFDLYGTMILAITALPITIGLNIASLFLKKKVIYL